MGSIVAPWQVDGIMGIGRIGKFQILGTLGTGAHSTILHVRRAKDSKPYALKVVPITDRDDLKFLEQARHEFRVAGRFDHPNLIKIYSLEIIRDWLLRVRKVHLLIEFINGKTLDTVQGLTLPRLVQVFLHVAEGMVHMHRRKVCHADLKPSNILLSRRGEVKIIDYGLAWIKDQSKGRVQGTPEYMAPEQAARAIVNESTDIYNFGATMYRMVTWKLPPNTLAMVEGMPLTRKAFNQMLQKVHELNPQAPVELCNLIHRCLRFYPKDRPERMSEVQGELDRLSEKMVRVPEDRLEAMEW
jgi:serine/threonine protein kinase